MIDITRHESRFDPANVSIGIVHIGFGAFHRAFQAVYLERWLDRNGGGPWGICAANIRSNRKIVDALHAQGCRFHVAEYRDREHVALREIAAIRKALFAGDNPEPLLAQMLDPACRIVSLSVSEKAYALSPAEERLLRDDPRIAHDVTNPGKPKTAPGILLEALRRRRAAGIEPFTVLCCDNMPANGKRAALAVTQLAENQSVELADWIRESVAFPCTMVDRIVPAMTDESRHAIEELIGHADPVAVACEAFSQWVIEDRFPTGRPDWEEEGVEMVTDAEPYETMKLRVLNGAHSLLAYVGLRRGHVTVAEAIADPQMATLVHEYFSEARATLNVPSHVDLDAYEAELIERFANDQLEHKLMQIAMDGSQKLPQRWLNGALVRAERGLSSPATAVGIAAWMHHVSGLAVDGHRYEVDDPFANEFDAIYRREGSGTNVVEALLALRAIFPERLATHRSFREAVLAAYLGDPFELPIH